MLTCDPKLLDSVVSPPSTAVVRVWSDITADDSCWLLLVVAADRLAVAADCATAVLCSAPPRLLADVLMAAYSRPTTPPAGGVLAQANCCAMVPMAVGRF